MQGYKTILFGALTALALWLESMGVMIPEGFAETYANEIMTFLITAYTFLRFISDGPVGDVFRLGWSKLVGLVRR